MEWFGPEWGAPVNKDCAKAETPDWACLACDKGFSDDDRGVVTPFAGDPSGRGKAAYHLRCFMENLGLTDSG